MSKRRKGFPSETKVGRGVRIVHGDQLLAEKLRRRRSLPVRERPTLEESLQQVGPVLTASTGKVTSRH